MACSNCYAALKATPGFQVETDNLGVPTKIALDLSATFEVNFEVRFSPSSDGSWKSLFSGPVSDNLIDKGLTFTMPLFGSLVSAINEWTVNIGIYITYQLKGQADPQSTLEGVFQTRQVFQWSGAQVAWTKGTGLSTELGTVSFNGSTVTPDLRDFAADLRGALAPCAGLEFNYGDETMSAVSSCRSLRVSEPQTCPGRPTTDWCFLQNLKDRFRRIIKKSWKHSDGHFPAFNSPGATAICGSFGWRLHTTVTYIHILFPHFFSLTSNDFIYPQRLSFFRSIPYLSNHFSHFPP